MDVISIQDVLIQKEIQTKKEEDDKKLLEGMHTFSVEDVKSAIVRWGLIGFPNSLVIIQIDFIVPESCSDGVNRKFPAYVEFLTGKTIDDHVKQLQLQFSGFKLSYYYNSSVITIHVSNSQ